MAWDALLRSGMVQDPSRVLFEEKCGACGASKHQDLQIKEEVAVLYTHHATAPAIQVRAFVPHRLCALVQQTAPARRRREYSCIF